MYYDSPLASKCVEAGFSEHINEAKKRLPMCLVAELTAPIFFA